MKADSHVQLGVVALFGALTVGMGGLPLRFAGALAVFALVYAALLSVRPEWTRGWSGALFAVIASGSAMSASMMLPSPPLVLGISAGAVLVGPPWLLSKLWVKYG